MTTPKHTPKIAYSRSESSPPVYSPGDCITASITCSSCGVVNPLPLDLIADFITFSLTVKGVHHDLNLT